MLQKRKQTIAQSLGAVISAQGRKAQLKQHGQTFRQIEALVFARVQILEHKVPDLCLNIQQQELEPLPRDYRSSFGVGFPFHKICVNQNANSVRRYTFALRTLGRSGSDHVVEDAAPPGHGVVVEKRYITSLGIGIHGVRHAPGSTSEIYMML